MRPHEPVDKVLGEYAEAYERALLAQEAKEAAEAEHAEALVALAAATRALDRWQGVVAAEARLTVKARHPEIDQTKTIEIGDGHQLA